MRPTSRGSELGEDHNKRRPPGSAGPQPKPLAGLTRAQTDEEGRWRIEDRGTPEAIVFDPRPSIFRHQSSPGSAHFVSFLLFDRRAVIEQMESATCFLSLKWLPLPPGRAALSPNGSDCGLAIRGPIGPRAFARFSNSNPAGAPDARSANPAARTA